MSLGYAERLSHREDLGGRLGDPELFEAPHVVLDKASQLAELIKDANKMIVFTGAGISTAAGIPDFRGPSGVWTLQRKGLPLPKLQTSFVYAKPSLTHQALLGLMQSGKLDYICSQNVDGLHLRSGVPREQLAELHGDCFAERCKKCKTEYIRDFEMDTVGFKQTGRRCSKPGCNGMLVDNILDWEDALPPAELKATQQHASAANLALCLGTSLQIIPAANLPVRTVKAGGKLAIINLQATPKDKKAAVVIHAKVDEVMAVIMQQCGIPIPVFARTDRVLLSHTATWKTDKQQPAYAAETDSDSEQALPADDDAAAEATTPAAAEAAAAAAAAAAGKGGAGCPPAAGPVADSSCSANSWGFTFCISSVHGSSSPLPMVASASVKFTGGAAAAGLKGRELSGQLPWKFSRTCPAGLQEVHAEVTLQLVEAADEDKRTHVMQYAISKPQQPPDSSNSRAKSTRRSSSQPPPPGASQVFSFITQQLDYTDKQQQLVQQLQLAAEESRLAAPAAAEAAAAAVAVSKPRKRSVSNGRGKHSSGINAQQQDGGVNGSSRGRSRVVNECDIQQAASQGGEGEQGVSVERTLEVRADGQGTTKQQGATTDSSISSHDEQSTDSKESDDSHDDDAGSEDIGAEPTGQQGQNTTGRPRKRTKRLNL